MIESGVLRVVARDLRRTLRRSLFYMGWLLLLLIPQAALLIWMKDPYVHATEISGDLARAVKNTPTHETPGPEAPAQPRASNSSDSKPQAYAVSLADGISIATILARTSNIHQDPPKVENHTTNHPEQTLAVDEKPRKRRIVEIAILILVLLALALFLSSQ